MRVLFATKNISKVNRFKDYLSEYGIELFSLRDIDYQRDCEESGEDCISNSIIKARFYSDLNDIVFAMDDNLFIEGIPDDIQPKDKVRRVNGSILNDSEMIEYYKELVKKYSTNHKLNTKWVYSICLIINSKEFIYNWDKSVTYLTDEISSVINPGYPLNSISKYISNDKFVSESNDIIYNTDKSSGVEDFLVKTIKENYDK